jgi:hypothetical protein
LEKAEVTLNDIRYRARNGRAVDRKQLYLVLQFNKITKAPVSKIKYP